MYYDRPQKKKRRPPTEPETRTRPRRRASLFRILFTTPNRDEREDDAPEVRRKRPSVREILIQNSIDASMTGDLQDIVAKEGLQELLKYALIVVASLPVMIIYPFVQKFFVKGVMIGSIKG